MHIHRWARREGTRGVRAFAHIYEHENGRELAELACEAYIGAGARNTGVALDLGDTASVRVHAGVAHVFDLYLSAESGRLAGNLYRRGGAWREWSMKLADKHVVSVSAHDGALWWALWHPIHEWKSSTPRWRSGHFNPFDWALGRQQYSSELVEGPVEVVVPMPERSYPATVKIELARWKRPRWPKVIERHTYDLSLIKRGDAPGYIPVPGKGENSWDCGPDGTFAQSGPGRTAEAAIADVVKSVLATRRRRGVPADYAELIS